MTFGNSPFLQDLTRMMSGAGSAAMQFGREMESYIQEKTEQFLSKMNLVTREEFDVVREMAQKAREENDALLKRIEALEGKKAPAAGTMNDGQ